ncbi:MAG: polyprenyl synthetase family protein [Bacillota bacterium]
MPEIEELILQKAEIINKQMVAIASEYDFAAGTLKEAMEYTLFSEGKRIRPVLTLMVAEMLSGDIEAACRTGVALEFIHSYSLIHDDLPVMDDDDYRRGKLSNHRVFGPGIAVLAGDGLLTRAFEILGDLMLAAETVVEIICLVAETAGCGGMVGGQVLDLEAEGRDIGLEELRRIHRSKTGALFRASVLGGAYCSQAEKAELVALEEFADNLGLLFQIIDDILDETGDSEKLGKEAGSDRELDKSTYISLLGPDGARREAEKRAAGACGALEIFGEEASDLRRLVDFVLKRDR